MKSKLQNCSKSTKNWHFANLTLTLHSGNVFAHTTKNSDVSIFYSYRDLSWTKHKFKKCFLLAKTLTIFGKIKFWFVVAFMECLFNCFHRKVLGDMVALHTDGRTYIHGGKNNICLPQGETYNTNIRSTSNQGLEMVDTYKNTSETEFPFNFHFVI